MMTTSIWTLFIEDGILEASMGGVRCWYNIYNIATQIVLMLAVSYLSIVTLPRIVLPCDDCTEDLDMRCTLARTAAGMLKSKA